MAVPPICFTFRTCHYGIICFACSRYWPRSIPFLYDSLSRSVISKKEMEDRRCKKEMQLETMSWRKGGRNGIGRIEYLIENRVLKTGYFVRLWRLLWKFSCWNNRSRTICVAINPDPSGFCFHSGLMKFYNTLLFEQKCRDTFLLSFFKFKISRFPSIADGKKSRGRVNSFCFMHPTTRVSYLKF